MGSEWIIGALAFVTIGGVLLLAITHFGAMMRDKKNRDSATGVLKGESSATTAVRGGEAPGHMEK